MSDYWEEMEKAEQERDIIGEYELYSAYERGRQDAIEEFKKSEFLQDAALVKAYEDGESNGWGAAIDAFAKSICELYTSYERQGYYLDTNNMIKQRVCDLAEQLKGERNEV